MPVKRARTASVAGQRVSLVEVATAAGCSTATVSRVVNGTGNVTLATTARVMGAIEALGYVPDITARSMRAGRTMTVGIVMNFDLHPATEIMTVLDALVRRAARSGYSSTVSFPERDRSDLDALLRDFAARRVDGLFYWNAQATPSLELYREKGIPVLAVGGRDPACVGIPLVNTDSGPVYDVIFRRLHGLGHRSVLEVGGASVDNLERHGRSASGAGLRWRTTALGPGPDAARQLLRDTMAGPDRPTAVLAPYATVVELMIVCEELGVGVPSDLSLVAQTESAAAALLRTPVATMTTDFAALGTAAVETMVRAIAGEEVTDVLLDHAVDWTERGSVGPAPRRSGRRTAARQLTTPRRS
jgi:LacI family transcriptional regulator